VHLEIHAIDFKIYEGLDFDFDKNTKPNYLSEISVSCSSPESRTSSFSKGQLYSVDEDYLS
jgi:hypothetical protein